jgi:hypothetical protein
MPPKRPLGHLGKRVFRPDERKKGATDVAPFYRRTLLVGFVPADIDCANRYPARYRGHMAINGGRVQSNAAS